MVTVLSYDVGTTGVKTCLFRIEEEIVPLDSATDSYGITIMPNGGAEQDPDEWWRAMANSTREIAQRHPDLIAQVQGVSFCSQAQALVMVDEKANAVHPSMSYMDQRSHKEMREIGGKWPRIAGVNAGILAKSLYYTGAVSASTKDPVWKYHWLKRNRPDEFARAHKWLDVKDALVARMTGEFAMSEDSAFATLLYDIRSDEMRFHPDMLKMMQVEARHMPTVVRSTDVVGTLLPRAAHELGLPAGIPIFSGGGDQALIPVGAGATAIGDTHVYIGTSGWVSTVTDKVTVDVNAMIATVIGSIAGRYNYFSELETAGKCLEWVRDHLALDEINIYLSRKHVAEDPESEFTSLYDYLSKVISEAPAGAGGVIFTPWLHGNRCPFEDPNARAMFFNLSLNTGKTEMLRAVVEGVCYHLRWFLETQEKKLKTSRRIRFVGGGALSAVTGQILADVFQRDVDVVAKPQDVGAVGAALIAAIGLGHVRDAAEAARLVPVARSFTPNPAHKEVYDRMFAAFVKLHPATKKLFGFLNADRRD